MTEASITHVEDTLGVKLPRAYRAALVRSDPSDVEEASELSRSTEYLIERNRHFTLDPADLSELTQSLFTRIRFRLLPRSRTSAIRARVRYKTEWADTGRFVIGDDLSELVYFIYLNDDTAAVHEFCLEDARSRIVAASMEEWVAKIRSGDLA
jgi:hypothetical protein